MNTFHIFIINLERDVEKKAHMQTLSKKYDLNAEFIDAVDGKLLPHDQIKHIYSEESALKNFGRELHPGELGCLLSHKKIYQKMVDESIQNALILEDDITLNEELFQVLNQKENFPTDMDLLLLGYWYSHYNHIEKFISPYEQKQITTNHKLIRFVETMHGTHGYYITYKGAKKILSYLINNVYMPIDHYTGSDTFMNLYGVYPPVIHLEKTFSLNSGLDKERKKIQNYSAKRNGIRFTIKKVLAQLGLFDTAKIFQKEILYFFKRRIKPKKYD